MSLIELGSDDGVAAAGTGTVPSAGDIRGFSFFGDSYVYVVFEDGTDLYWARTRILG